MFVLSSLSLNDVRSSKNVVIYEHQERREIDSADVQIKQL